jgi:hypothetical protein
MTFTRGGYGSSLMTRGPCRSYLIYKIDAAVRYDSDLIIAELVQLRQRSIDRQRALSVGLNLKALA